MVTGIISQKGGFYFNSFVLEEVVSIKVLQRKIQRNREKKRERERKRRVRGKEKEIYWEIYLTDSCNYRS